MKSANEFSKYKKYFTSDNRLKYVGGVIFTLGLLLFWCGRGYFAHIAMCIFLVAGLVVLLISSLGRAGESDIDAYIKLRTEGMEYRPKNEKTFLRRQSNILKSVDDGIYELGDGVLVKRGNDGLIRSTRYTRHIIYPLDTGMVIVYRRVSLLSDEMTEGCFEIEYADVNSLTIETEKVRVSLNGGESSIPRAWLNVKWGADGVLRLPIKDSLSNDDFVARINRFINEAKA